MSIPSWLCRNCGAIETEAMFMISHMTIGSSIIDYEHMPGRCVELATEEDFWKETWS